MALDAEAPRSRRVLLAGALAGLGALAGKAVAGVPAGKNASVAWLVLG